MSSSYVPQSVDTDRDTDELMMQKYRGMSAFEKAACISSLCRTVSSLAVAGILERHPKADSEEVVKRLAALKFGRDVARQFFNWDPDVEGW